jgi:hypothetical protein
MAPTSSIAFKEWAVVCDSLARGEQTIILRKGGIHEGRAGFRVAHREFWLLPTTFHAAADALTQRGQTLLANVANLTGAFRIAQFAVVEEVLELSREEDALALEGLHIWSPATVRERFHYKRPGLYCLIARIYSRPQSFEVIETPAIAGCRSWVELPEAMGTEGMIPALVDDAFAQAVGEVRRRTSV